MPGTPPYAELHCHSAYSFLDGVSLPDELAYRAAELGYDALALTDHNSVSGSMELAQVAPHAGLRAIHGAEIDVIGGGEPSGHGEPGGRGASGGHGEPGGQGGPGGHGVDDAVARAAHGTLPGRVRRHLTLLVCDARGWSNLCRIVTCAHAHTREGFERAEPAVDIGTVTDRCEGLVCLTGCARHGVHDESSVRLLLDAFGPERLRVELQRPYARHDRARNRALEALARRLGVRCVATGDVHAHTRERAQLQDAFVALRHHTTLDASESLRRGNHAHALSAPEAMARRFANDHPEAVRETLALSEQLRFELTKDLGYSYPGSEDRSAPRRLAELCWARLDERYPTGARARADGASSAQCSQATAKRPSARLARTARAEAQARLEGELRVIERLGLAGFFLLHHEMLVLAREVAAEVRGPDSARSLLAPGRGRGSSVSSIVCYLTGLSHIDPVANGLLLGRFLHDDLRGLPDIDLDFPREIREVLIPRVHERFGGERAALVAAFPTFRVRGAVRELGKALGLPRAQIERVARTADGWGGSSAERDIDAALGTDTAGRSPRWRWLARLVKQAYGLPRHLSQHPGGMVVSTRSLIDCCPVVPAAMEGRQMVQWDKDSCADAGFLKIDLLGLGMLSAVERCVEEIARTRGERIDLSRIPFDERETFDAIRAADTVGVFQIESRAQMQSLRRTRPGNLDDLTVQVAIVRPGPIQGGAVNPYIERRARRLRDPSFEPPYEHPSLEPVLRETLGTIIFQDQVMQVAEAFCGFSPGEADGLRRAMSRKRSLEAMEENRERFLAGAVRHSGAGPRTAQRVWEMVSGFAGFGFPKAHAAAFGLLAYQSTWLRVHYGPEFLCALLNEQPMGFYAPDSLVHEAQRRGIAVLGVDVNASLVQCTVERTRVQRAVERTRVQCTVERTRVQRAAERGFASVSQVDGAAEQGAVRLGLGYVKGTIASEVADLVAERERGGPYRDLGDLAGRVALSRATLEQLAWSGACDSLAGDRRVSLWQLGLAASGERAAEGTQLALPLDLPDAPRLRPLERWERLIADYASSGVTAADHALAALRPRLSAHMLTTSAQLPRLPSGCSVTIAGLVIARQRPSTARGVMFLLFEDEWGVANLIVPEHVYERRRALARAEPLLLARGRLERSAGVVNVIVRELAALERFLAPDADEDDGNRAMRVRHLPGVIPAPDEGDDAEEVWEYEQGVDGAQVGASLRAVAPPVQSFAAGRRR